MAVGNSALHRNTTASNNVMMGVTTGQFITTGCCNVAIGNSAMNALTTANHNTAIGQGALSVATTGTQNVVVGNYAGDAITSGGYNSCMGTNAGTAMTTAHSCVMIGDSAGDVLTDGHSCIFIGRNAGGTGTDVTHQMSISTGGGASKGNTSAFIDPGNGPCYQGNNATAWTQTSDRRIKKDITPSTKGLQEINQITPCTFYYKSDEELNEIPEFEGCKENLPQDVLTTSAIAQDVQKVFPEAVTERNDYGMLAVQPDPIMWAMVNAIKELSAEVAELKEWKAQHDG